jgi:parallel beta-helix repeat protein
VYRLQNNIVATADLCFEIAEDEVILDCNNHLVTGPGSGYGIYAAGHADTTIKNCIITNFDYGIYFYSSANNTIKNNIVSSNVLSGIYLESGTDNNILTENTICSNAQIDIYSDSSSNTGDDNGCDVWQNWKDDSVADGCAFDCQGTSRQTTPTTYPTGGGAPSIGIPAAEGAGGGTFDMYVGDTVTIDVQGAPHSVSLVEVTSDHVTVDIFSPLQITLSLGETKDVDVNGNGVNDLRVELLQIILPNGAKIRLTPLTEKAPTVPTPPTTIPPVPQISAPTAMFTMQQGSFLTFLVFLLVAVITYVMWKEAKKKKAAKKPSEEEQLYSYIRKERARKHPEAHIREQLLKIGWSKEKINKILKGPNT